MRDKIKVEALTTDDAISLAKAGKELIDIAAEPEAQTGGEGGEPSGSGGEDESSES